MTINILQIYLNSDLTLASVQFSYLLLESNRVYAQNENESNFHIFHSLKFATGNLCKDLYLDITTNYKVGFIFNLKFEIEICVKFEIAFKIIFYVT